MNQNDPILDSYNVFEDPYNNAMYGMASNGYDMNGGQAQGQEGMQMIQNNMDLQGSQGSNLSLGFSQLSQGGMETLQQLELAIFPPQPGPEMNYFTEGIPLLGDDEYLGSSSSLIQPHSIIGNKFGNMKAIVAMENGHFSGHNSTQEEEISSSQSSDISQEGKIPSLEQYPGKYNFMVKLGQNMNKKTAVYSSEINKLYCNNDIKILFNIHLDCKSKAMKDLWVKSEIVFSENTHIMEPVKRCITCLNKEAEANGVKFTDVNEDSIFNHVIRVCDHEKAVHERSAKQNRYFAMAPLERPQLGSANTICRNYEFKCLNTCFVYAKKKLSVIFSLLENDKPVGRSVMGLKVCSCPARDYKNDTEEKSTKKGKTTKRKAETRRQQIDEEQKLDVLSDAANEKQRCLNPPMALLSIKSEPGSSAAAAMQSKIHERKAGQNPFSQSNSEPDDSEVDMSQGSQDSFTTRTISKLAPGIKMLYELKKKGDEKDKMIADTGFGMLKSFHRLSEKCKTRTQSPGPAPQGNEPEGHGSPDSGVNAKTP